ncbi:ABC transporter permease [Rhizobium sp. TH2]|uniref:ABC transporter permease n=1 Tax=Rhizobium sp. TH2 TaxID=2775403 RepID=UPI002157D703|nr:ABC transporter permease [Rhizobium sp. TH2]UVC08538.1 ABC transporter permease [Rhizobium sp. TH2]
MTIIEEKPSFKTAGWQAQTRFLPEIGDLSRVAVLIALVAAGQVLYPGFLSSENLRVIFTAVAGIGILAFGMTMVVITGEIDLSVAGVAVLSTVIGGLLLPTGSPVLILGATLLCGLCLGIANGVLVAKVGISSLISTLAMLGIAGALANIFSAGQATYPEKIAEYMWFGRGALLGVPVPIILLAVLALICVFITRSSTFGRKLYATGGNARAALLSGIRIDRVKIAVFAFCGLCAALTGLIESARLGYINPAAFPGLELKVLAVTVLGGAALAGGTGSVFGTLTATLIIGVINNLLNQMGVSFYMQQVVTALVILVVVMPGMKNRRFVK